MSMPGGTMPRTVTLTPGQPAISPNPKKGQKVTRDQFSCDFTVEVEQDGCYVIEFVLKEHRTFPIFDDLILSSQSASGQPICIRAGAPQHFRVTTSEPPAGPSPITPMPPGTTELDPVDGRWPDHASSTGEFYVEIEVFRVG